MFYLDDGRIGADLKLYKEASLTHVIMKKGTLGHFCGLDRVLIFVCAQTWLKSGFAFVSHDLWNCLCSTGENHGLPLKAKPTPT